MQKDEIIDLHETFQDLVVIVEKCGHNVDLEEYNNHGVTPDDTHRSKADHKRSIFTLGAAVAEAMSEDSFSSMGRIEQRMEEMAAEASK